jgi:uncharacterized protein (TIGR00255 family)
LTKLADYFILYIINKMIQSMTGFGSATNKDFSVEIRSLNHRFIDIAIKMPAHMSQHEIALRNKIKEKFQRGRFDVSVLPSSLRSPLLKINKPLARSFYAALQELQNDLSLPGTVNIETLAGYREFLVEEEPAYDMNALFNLFNDAARSLEEMRLREGRFLSDDIRRRIVLLEGMTAEIKNRAPDEVIRWREKFTERLKLIVEAGMIDNSRIAQEAALMAEKLDIAEEISRIENHLAQFKRILDNEPVVGKKLDFLLQELNREVNTLTYKAGDYSISHLAIEMKTEIEKIREQVQNIQ